MLSNEPPDNRRHWMDDPDRCDQCDEVLKDFERFGSEFDEDKSFCSLICLEAYDEEHGKPVEGNSTGREGDK